MSTCMVRLTAAQRKSRPVFHPLLDECPTPLTDGEVNDLVDYALKGDENARERLILGHLSMLSHTVGRYLYHWPVTHRFLDEMVSVGLYAMTEGVADLTESSLKDKSLGVYLLYRIYKYVEEEIAMLRGMVPASIRTNQRRAERGLDPIFGEVVSDLGSSCIQEGHFYIEPGFEECDVLEAVGQLRGEFDQLDVIFDKRYWGLTDEELSNLTGIARRTVCWYRSELLRRYYELTGD